MENWQSTLIRQYFNSPRINRILDNFNANVDCSEFFDQFIDNIWDVRTATGYGLDVWGRIVGVGRNLSIPGCGICAGLQAAETLSLNDNDFRQLILGAAGSNLWDGTTAGAEKVIDNLLPEGGWSVIDDHHDKTMTVMLGGDSVPAYAQSAIMSDIVCVRPAGVGLNGLIIVVGSKLFAFNVETEYLGGWNEGSWPSAYLSPASLGLWFPGMYADVETSSVSGIASGSQLLITMTFSADDVTGGDDTVAVGSGGRPGSGVRITFGDQVIFTTCSGGSATVSFSGGIMNGLSLSASCSLGQISCSGDEMTITQGQNTVMAASIAFPFCYWSGYPDQIPLGEMILGRDRIW